MSSCFPGDCLNEKRRSFVVKSCCEATASPGTARGSTKRLGDDTARIVLSCSQARPSSRSGMSDGSDAEAVERCCTRSLLDSREAE